MSGNQAIGSSPPLENGAGAGGSVSHGSVPRLLELTNRTIADNSESWYGGGLACGAMGPSSDVEFKNSLVGAHTV